MPAKSEHVQAMTDRDEWYLETMTAYGALLLGPAPTSPTATR